MRVSSPKLTAFFVLLLVLLLVPRYSVYAVDSTSAARPDLKISNQTQRLTLIQQTFDQRIAGMKDKIASREAELRLKLAKFTDQAKAAIADRVNKNLNLINQNQTAALNKNLDAMTSILDGVVTRSGTASGSAQVVAARSALDTSRTAVTNQALKDYTINISTESAIRKDVQVMREKLHTDLKTTRQTVLNAKASVLVAIRSILAPSASPSASGSAIINRVKESTATGLPVN